MSLILFSDLNHDGVLYIGDAAVMEKLVDNGASCYVVDPVDVAFVRLGDDQMGVSYVVDVQGKRVRLTNRRIVLAKEHLFP